MPKREQRLADSVGFELLWDELGRDIEASIRSGMEGRAVFAVGRRPLAVFRHALSEAIRDIETGEWGDRIQRFIRVGPYVERGTIPPDLVDRYVSDEDTGSIVAFIHSHMVSSFQGALAEMLAVRPCQELMSTLTAEGKLPPSTRLFVGDVVKARKGRAGTYGKAADFHLMVGDPAGSGPLTLAGVGEAKSFARSVDVSGQLGAHGSRARSGLVVGGKVVEGRRLRIGVKGPTSLIRVTIRPSRWKLPRGFRIDDDDGRTFVTPEVPMVPSDADTTLKTGKNEWAVRLRWSHEALAAAALGVSFWYMRRVGEAVFRASGSNPWPEMTPAEAGANAAEAALYYAIVRARSTAEEERAVALYNTYGYGYGIGMNFRAGRRREMLWPADLREILATGIARKTCRIVRSRMEVKAAPPESCVPGLQIVKRDLVP